MRLPFNEKKATQAAAYLLRLRGGRMSYMKLIKLLYLADRVSLTRRGRPITTDRYVSMDRGPVLSRTLNLITEDRDPAAPSFWAECITEPVNYEVGLVADPGADELSQSEERILEEIFAEHGRKSRWELVKLTHDLPEWQDPEGGALPIEYETILKAGGQSPEDIRSVVSDMEEAGALTSILARYAPH